MPHPSKKGRDDMSQQNGTASEDMRARVISDDQADTQAQQAPAIVYEEDDDERALHDYIANLDDTTEELVDIPQWRRRILVVGMTADKKLSILQRHTNIKTGQANMRLVYADMLIECCYHPKTRKPVFSLADREMLMHKNNAVVDLLTDVVERISGVGAKAREALKNA